MDGPALGTMCWDQHLAVAGTGGSGSALLNVGTPFVADVLRNARFCVPATPAGTPTGTDGGGSSVG